MKIAVYAIAKNEAQFVQRWANSCKEADYRFILDTGSTDNTRKIAEQLGIDCKLMQFFPWRFDIARNHALSMLPDDIDYCIALDMDEVLVDGWRTALEAVAPDVTRPRYKYVWSWNDDGSEGLVYGGDKIHARHGYRWEHPVHEVLKSDNEIQCWMNGFQIHHFPDKFKSRGQYFDLLKLAVAEKPDDDRNQFYLGREYFYHGQNDLAVQHLLKATELSAWQPERAAAFRMIYKMTGDVSYLFDAFKCDPVRRETLVGLAQHYYEQQDWVACFQFARAAVDITVKPLDYLCEPDAWGWLPWDLAAISAHHLGKSSWAVYYGQIASGLCPDDERLKNNLDWYYGPASTD